MKSKSWSFVIKMMPCSRHDAARSGSFGNEGFALTKWLPRSGKRGEHSTTLVIGASARRKDSPPAYEWTDDPALEGGNSLGRQCARQQLLDHHRTQERLR